MRRPGNFAILLCCGLLFAASCVKLSQRPANSPAAHGQNATPARTLAINSKPLININTATAAEFERLPGVGPVLAARILEHRERYGRFHRAEHLILVRGMSDNRFRQLRHLIIAE